MFGADCSRSLLGSSNHICLPILGGLIGTISHQCSIQYSVYIYYRRCNGIFIVVLSWLSAKIGLTEFAKAVRNPLEELRCKSHASGFGSIPVTLRMALQAHQASVAGAEAVRQA